MYRVLIILLLTIFSTNVGYSALLDNGACCYEPGSNDPIREYLTTNSCPQSNQIYLGRPDDSDRTDFCKIYENERLGCRISAGTCSAFVNGNAIYDIPEVLNSFDFGAYCSDLVPFSASCSGNQITAIGGVPGDTDPGDDSTVGDPDDFNLTFFDTEVTEEERVLCSNAGGPFGFFNSQDSCESLEVAGQTACVYNPYYGGKLSSKFASNSASYLIDKFENSCIPKAEIKTCFDYKTERNCGLNPSQNLSRNLENGCAWINSSEYADGLFEEQIGICIPESINNKKYYVETEFPYRLNLLQNPSFEVNVGWTNIKIGNIISDRDAYHGNRYYRLDDTEINQYVSYVDSDISYEFSGYFLPISSNSSSRISIKLESIDRLGNILDERTLERTYSQNEFFSENELVFKRVNLATYIPHEDALYVRAYLSSQGDDIYLDSVIFEPFSRDSLVISDSIFKPIEEIPSKASKCELCYDPLNLNYCTEEKSDYMGDCSYMVNSVNSSYTSQLSNYLGKEENQYTRNSPWTSQSIPNSKVFCEMFVTEETCEDHSNHPNRVYEDFHPFSKSSLCKWDETVGGCFKDSNGDNLPDTRNAIPQLRSLPDFRTLNFEYDYKRDESAGTPSDYALSCDRYPPNSYMYIKGKDVNGTEVIIDQDFDSNKLVGDLQIYVDIKDPVFEACSDFNLDRKLYIDYAANNYTGFRVVDSNVLKENYAIKDYLFFDGKSLTKDGFNNISIISKDQSGNFGKDWKFDLSIDALPPEVNLIQPSAQPNGFLGILGPSSNLTFQISDYSKVDYCNYVLMPNSGSIPSSYYNGSGSFDLANKSSQLYNFTLPIYNSSARGDFYLLGVECADVFGQLSSQTYAFVVDHNTEVLLIEPQPYFNYTFDIGYMNSSGNLIAYSSDDDLSSCQLNIGPDFNGTNSLSLSRNASGFTVQGHGSKLFYYNITGLVDFSSDGIKNGTIECSDNNGNSFSRDLTYYYDTIAPIFNGYYIVGPQGFGLKTLVEVGGKYYTRTNEQLIINSTLSGTGSWINDSFLDMRLYNVSGLTDHDVSPSFNFMLNPNNYDANVEITNFEIPKIIDLGIPTSENNLYEVSYRIGYKDKAGNINYNNITYYSDDSEPSFEFSGDIMSSDENRIYTNVLDPSIDVSFNAPMYRTYTCNVTATQSLDVFQKSFAPTNNLQFKLSEISQLFNIDNDKSVTLGFSCQDIYGLKLSDSFELVYDDVVPILNDMYFADGNFKFYRNYENSVYDDLVDELVFDLEDTNEVGYVCQYRFDSPSNLYSCNSSIYESEFISSGIQKTQPLNILSREQSPDSICVRTDEFYTRQSESIANDENLNTIISVEGQCYDKVGFSTQTREQDLEINYVRGELGSLHFEYRDGYVYPVLRSFTNYNSIRISKFEDGRNPLLIMSNPTAVGNYYEYTSNQGISKDLFDDGSNLVFAVAFDSSDTVIEYITGTVIVDKFPPKVDLSIPDSNNGIVYSEVFEIFMRGYDESGGEISRLELYLENDLIYTSENLSDYDENYLDKPDSSLNYFNIDFTSYEGQVTFSGELENLYTFTLKAYDEGGNVNETSETVQIKDGVGIILQDSSNSFVDPSRFSWVTKTESPIINFRTSKYVDSCLVYPMIDQEWIDITGDSNIQDTNMELRNTDQFSFDLSVLGSYDLTQLEDKSASVNIICLYNNSYYNYTRDVKYVEFIPDYTLTSSEGFLLNEEPFSTTIDVRSVGPYRYITCEYKIDGSEPNGFVKSRATEFREEIDFSSYSTGNHTLSLVCEDIVGNVGYEKEYEFYINKQAELNLEEVQLSRESNLYLPYQDTIYINQDGTYDINFKLNKKNNIACSYMINSNTALSGPINFFRNLFSIGSQEVLSMDNNYEYTASGLEFDINNPNTLRIDCNVRGENEGFSEEFNVIYDNSGISSEVLRN